MPVFLKYGKVKGEATEPAHRGWIDLTSAQLGATRRITRDRERPAESPSVTEMIVTRKIDSASPALQREALGGEQVTAFVDFVDDGGSVYFRLVLSGTVIAGFTVSSGGDSPTESLTLNFTKIEFVKTPGTPPP